MMFTGIITEVGTVAGVTRSGSARLSIKAPKSAAELKPGDSVSIQGACQTVITGSVDTFQVEAVEETLKKTTLGSFRSGTKVNLELAVRPMDRMGGHIVQGHVDGVGSVVEIEERASSRLVTVEFPAEFGKYVVPVGSVAINGVSLTVASTDGRRLTVSLIPHTLANTTLPDLQVGEKVNLEFDILGKYVERLMRHGDDGGITKEKLTAWGYGG